MPALFFYKVIKSAAFGHILKYKSDGIMVKYHLTEMVLIIKSIIGKINSRNGDCFDRKL